MLLRIENNGATHIDTSDYAVLDGDTVGVRVRFPGRRVAGMVVTELSDEYLRHSFGPDSGLGVADDGDDGVVELPKVPLNRGAHYKVLAALEGPPGADGRGRHSAESAQAPPPKVVGGIKGGVGDGGIQETRSRTGASRQAVALICFLVLVVLGQFAVSLGDGGAAAPLDCATGDLTVTGSTAFAPVLREAADSYGDTCPGAAFTFTTQGSADGLRRLDGHGGQEGSAVADMLAFSDGTKGEGFPQLLPRPLAFSLFTMVINEEAGVQDLSLAQIRRVYDGDITNWREVGGADLPVRLIGRHSDSGSRRTFQERVLDGRREPGDTSDDCLERAPGAPGDAVLRCARGSTGEVLDTVAATPGALGYSEAGAAAEHAGVLLLRIDGQRATLEAADQRAYPFWETEYAYTYGEPPADSLAASFLRYLTNEVGRDIVRSYGHRPCADLSDPVRCRPE